MLANNDPLAPAIARDALRQCEECFRQLADNLEGVFFFLRGPAPQGEVFYVSPAYDRVMGRSRDDLRTRSDAFLEAIHPDDRARVAAGLSRTAEGRFDERTRVLWPDGTVRWIHARTFPICDESGRVCRVAGIVEDITDLVLSQEALATRARQQTAIAEVGRRALEAPDLDTLLEQAVRTIAEALGADHASFIELGKDGTLLVRTTVGSPQTLAGHRFPAGGRGCQSAFTLAQRGSVLSLDYATETRFDVPAIHRELGILSGATVLVGDGHPPKPFGVLCALSRRRAAFAPSDLVFLEALANVLAAAIERARAQEALLRSELMLRQSQKMEAVGRLAGGVAHDFNNLLTAITGYTELALARLREGDPLAADLEQVKHAAVRASSLTRQLLVFSRKQVTAPKVIDPNESVQNLQKMLGRLIGENVELRLALERQAGLVKIDPSQFEQVIMNLVVNARDAMPSGGRVTLETARVELAEQRTGLRGLFKPGPHVMIAVSDTGCGMGPDVLAHLFEPFFTTKEVGRGTGLGLSTIYAIVEAAGGCLSVDSEVGRGTCMKTYLPLASETAATAVPSPADPKLGHESLLLVEDDELVRELAAITLGHYGYAVTTAREGSDALREIDRLGKIDMLITDVVMPGMSGVELAARVLAARPTARVLYTSGYTSGAFRNLDEIDDRADFLEKPFTPQGLAAKVREVLDRPPKA